MADQAGTTDSTDTDESGAGEETHGTDTGLADLQEIVRELDLEPGQLAERLKASRKWEERAKANAEAAQKLKEIEDANLSEQEKLQRERDEARVSATTAAAEAARLKAAVKHGLTEDDLDLLGDGTPDEIEARAAKLAARLAAATPPEGSRPVNGMGKTPDDSAGGGSQLERDLRERLGI